MKYFISLKKLCTLLHRAMSLTNGPTLGELTSQSLKHIHFMDLNYILSKFHKLLPAAKELLLSAEAQGFFWLLRQDHLNTRDLFQRKTMIWPSYSCVLCDRNAPETRTHLFFECRFAQACWHYVCPYFQLQLQSATNYLEAIAMIKDNFHQPFFMEVITLCSWPIWKTLNAQIFNDIRPSL